MSDVRRWLHIAAVVAAHAVERGLRRLDLIGTRYLVESEVYLEKLEFHGLEYVRPNAAEREASNRIIFDELVYGVFTADAVAYFQPVVVSTKNAGCDAVVLGCTEKIPLIVSETLHCRRSIPHACWREQPCAGPWVRLHRRMQPSKERR